MAARLLSHPSWGRRKEMKIWLIFREYRSSLKLQTAQIRREFKKKKHLCCVSKHIWENLKMDKDKSSQQEKISVFPLGYCTPWGKRCCTWACPTNLAGTSLSLKCILILHSLCTGRCYSKKELTGVGFFYLF